MRTYICFYIFIINLKFATLIATILQVGIEPNSKVNVQFFSQTKWQFYQMWHKMLFLNNSNLHTPVWTDWSANKTKRKSCRDLCILSLCTVRHISMSRSISLLLWVWPLTTVICMRWELRMDKWILRQVQNSLYIYRTSWRGLDLYITQTFNIDFQNSRIIMAINAVLEHP